jgi:hypothetical protein
VSQIERDTLAQALQERFGYAKQQAPRVAEQILDLPPDLRSDFDVYWETGAVPSRDVDGYNAEHLVATRGMTPIGAILTLGWLRREPLRAKRSLQRRRDYVVTPRELLDEPRERS